MPAPDSLFARWSSAELLVAAHFAAQGYSISLPTAPCGYDLIVDSGYLYRVQVKTLSWRLPRQREAGKGDRAQYAVSLLSSTRKACSATVFDLLVAVCAPDRIYALPVELIRCPTNPNRLIRTLRIKLPGTRLDSKRAAERWVPYLNNFTLPGGGDGTPLETGGTG